MGMPRRVYTYGEGLGWDALNLVSTVGAIVLAAGFAVVVLDLVLSWRRGRPAPANPWGAESLEWSIPSPPPAYNFDTFPVVSSLHPLWDDASGAPTAVLVDVDGESVLHPHGGHHRTLLTSVLDAGEPCLTTMPGASAWPFVLAAGLFVFCVGVLIPSWVVATVGAAALIYAFYRWHRDG
jgi:heme/copper-type cytochrome/quinol oxidase subunit 1